MSSLVFERIKSFAEHPAIISQDKVYSFRSLLRKMEQIRHQLSEIHPGDAVSLEADFSLTGIATLLTLLEKKAIIVPLTKTLPNDVKASHREVARVQKQILIEQEQLSVTSHSDIEKPALYQKLGDHPGLVLFSSGSTGPSKAAVHDFSLLIERFRTQSKSHRLLAFMQWDHIGGINTLFYSLCSGGCLILANQREPNAVMQLVEAHQVDLLPTTPSFLRFLLLTRAWKKHDVTSLKTISYGTEPMPESTLKALRAELPEVRFVQTYGLTEIGILRVQSQSSDSLWVKLSGEGFQTRVTEGLLEVKARSSMLGYLNAQSPFTDDGWFKTNDVVEQNGEWLKILGRSSDLINVGGEKVYPNEVESVLLQMPNVVQVNVKGQTNPLLGQTVFAEVELQKEENVLEFLARMRAFCQPLLPKYKIPQSVALKVHSQN